MAKVLLLHRNHVPLALIYLRLVLGVLLLSLSFLHLALFPAIAISLFTIGLLSDVLDGIVARRLNISTATLRRLDSTVDQIFWSLTALATYVTCPDFFHQNSLQLFLLFGAEALTYVVSFLKFKREVATHALSSKLWTLFIFATLVQLMATCQSTDIFQICFYIGLATRLEIIAILLTLKQWTHDVPSLYHALQLRKNKPIKRHKLFNG